MSQRKNSVVQELIISRDPEVMGGTPVFAGTRVPVQHLIEHLVGNYSIEEFREGFPGVSREQIEELLWRVNEMLKDAPV